MNSKSTTKKDIALLGNVSLAKIQSASERQKLSPATYPQHYPVIRKEHSLAHAADKF